MINKRVFDHPYKDLDDARAKAALLRPDGHVQATGHRMLSDGTKAQHFLWARERRNFGSGIVNHQDSRVVINQSAEALQATINDAEKQVLGLPPAQAGPTVGADNRSASDQTRKLSFFYDHPRPGCNHHAAGNLCRYRWD